MILEKIIYGWMLIALLFVLGGAAICFLVLIFCDLFLLHGKKDNVVTLYCEKWINFLVDEERMIVIVLYPLALIGKYYLAYAPIVIIMLEYIVIFKLFQWGVQFESANALEHICWTALGTFCAFKTARFFISLYDSFYKKLPDFLVPRKKYQLEDKVGYVCSLLIIVFLIGRSLLDKGSFISGFISWIGDGLSKMQPISVLLLILVLCVISYKHIKEAQIKKDKKDKGEEYDEEGDGFWLKSRKKHRRKHAKKNKK